MNNSTEAFAQFYITLITFLIRGKHLLINAGAEHDLTGMQAITLTVIDGTQGSPMNELSNVMFCDASNITGLIDGLEHKGLVTRQEKAGDRRVKIAQLTAKGAEVRKALVFNATGQNGDDIFANLTATERTQFMQLLEKLAKDQPGVSSCPKQK